MPDAIFHVAVDPARAFVRIELGGFFTLANVAAFAEHWHVAHAQLRCAPNQHVTLCDLSRMNIQTQDVVAAFTDVVRDPQRQGRRIAMVVGVSLARHQAKRLNLPDREGIAFFYDSAEAEQWLFSADRSAARGALTANSPESFRGGAATALSRSGRSAAPHVFRRQESFSVAECASATQMQARDLHG